jgi:DNA-binding LacI/PurR family transcriptional regulator
MLGNVSPYIFSARISLPPTVYTVAKKASVSVATVSRVLNNSPKVKEKTRNRVLKIIE